MKTSPCGASLSEHFDGCKFDNRAGENKPSDPSKDVAEAILNTQVGVFKPLTGVFSCPTLRPDGSIIERPGYDERTGLLINSDVTLPPIPDPLTTDDALAALATLKDLLAEFPFVFDASAGESATCNPSLSVALSGIMTAVIRGVLPVVPAHGARAPAAGTGKSYLWDVMAAIRLGKRCPVIAVSRDAQETEKKLTAEALSGSQITNLDNINGEIGSDLLCQMVSQEELTLRPLGTSQQVTVSNRSSVYFSGNNVRPRADLTRRVLIADLDRKMERPETYKFPSDPVKDALADRGKYVAAVLTICKAYIQVGKPDQGLEPLKRVR